MVPPAARAIEQTAPGALPGPELVESFDGLGLGFSGPQGVASVRNPSDNSLAVGPDHIVQTVNGAGMAVFTRKGRRFDTTGRVLYGPVRVNNVFKGFGGNCEARVSGDVVVRYDQLADRWLIVMPLFSRGPVRSDLIPPAPPGVPQSSVPGIANQPGPAAPLYQPPLATPTPSPTPGPRPSPTPGPQGPYSMCYAISATPDPLGAWYRYEFLRPLFPDYPRPAIWTDGYYVPTSTSDDRISEAVATEKHACVVDRAKMLKGEPAAEQCVIIHDVNFLNNADIDGRALPPKGAPNIMMAAGGRQLDHILEDDLINVWQFHVDWKDPRKTRVLGPQAIKVAPYHYLCGGQLTYCVPQPGSELRLDAQGDKLMARLVYRRVKGRESVVAARAGTSSGSVGTRSGAWLSISRGPTRPRASIDGCRVRPWTGSATSASGIRLAGPRTSRVSASRGAGRTTRPVSSRSGKPFWSRAKPRMAFLAPLAPAPSGGRTTPRPRSIRETTAPSGTWATT
jgi:hypothetical protein